jgi:hypothetical protein
MVTELAILMPALAEKHATDIHRLAPDLAARLGLAAEPARFDAAELARGLIALWLDVGRPCVLSVSGAESLDTSSLELFELLVERAQQLDRTQSVPLLFLVSLTDDAPEAVLRAITWLKDAGLACQVELGPLDAEAVRALIVSMLGASDLPDDLVHALTTASGGNPWLVREGLQALVRQGQIEIGPAGWLFRSSLTPLDIEASLESSLASRLAELGPNAMLVLRSLAVIVHPLSLDDLGALFELDRDEVLRIVTELRRRRFVFLSEGGSVHFSASRWRKRVVDSVPAAERVELHQGLAELLEASADPALLAFHHERANDPSAAGAAYCRAVETSFSRGDLKAVLLYAEKAAQSGVEGGPLGRVCSLAAEAGRLCGDRVSAESFGQRALALLTPGTPDWLQASRVVIAAFSPLAPRR